MTLSLNSLSVSTTVTGRPENLRIAMNFSTEDAGWPANKINSSESNAPASMCSNAKATCPASFEYTCSVFTAENWRRWCRQPTPSIPSVGPTHPSSASNLRYTTLESGSVAENWVMCETFRAIPSHKKIVSAVGGSGIGSFL